MTALPPSALYRVALVMIVRDEAPRISRAIHSLKPWVDECVVLDTGSRDDTVALAQAAGARVGHFVWCDDFAAARNAALELAGADWHVVLDADEWLSSGGASLAALRQQAPAFMGQVMVDSHFGHDGERAPSWLPRVLPGWVRYEGRIHEQPRRGPPTQRLPVVFEHLGYAPAALAQKAGRNAALLGEALKDNPNDPYLWYQLGKDHDVYERWAQAIDCFDHACNALPIQGPLPSWRHDLEVRCLHALKRAGRHAEGVLRAEAGLGLWSHSPDFFFALGDLLLDWATQDLSRADELLPMIEDAWQRCLMLGERPDLEGSVAGRGSYLAARNLVLLYQVLERPDDAAALMALAQPPAPTRLEQARPGAVYQPAASPPAAAASAP